MLKKISKILCLLIVGVLLISPESIKAEGEEAVKVTLSAYDELSGEDITDLKIEIRNSDSRELLAEGNMSEYEFSSGSYEIGFIADGYYSAFFIYDTEKDKITDIRLGLQPKGTSRVYIYTYDADNNEQIVSRTNNTPPYKIVNKDTGEEVALNDFYSFEIVTTILREGNYEISQILAPTEYEINTEVHQLTIDGTMPYIDINNEDLPEDVIEQVKFANKHKEASEGLGSITIKAVNSETGDEITGLKYFIEKVRKTEDSSYYDIAYEDVTDKVEDVENGDYFVGIVGEPTIEVNGKYYGINYAKTTRDLTISDYVKDVEVIFYLNEGEPLLTIVDDKSVGTLYIGSEEFKLNGEDVTEGSVSDASNDYLIRFNGDVYAEYDVDGKGGEGEYLLYYAYDDGEAFGPNYLKPTVNSAPVIIGSGSYGSYKWKKNEYYVASGDNSVYERGSDETLVFVIKNSIDDENTFSKLNGLSVDRKYGISYLAEEGSAIISLEGKELEELDNGKHKVQVYFQDGFAEANFEIKEKAVEPEKKEETKPVTPTAKTNAYQAPKTGVEDINTSRYLVLAALGLLVLAKKK